MNGEKFVLENNLLKVTVCSKGAEVKSVFNKKLQVEHLWQGDKHSWKGTFPILFPIVGKLKNNQYVYHGKTYHMTQHGFARDSCFTVTNITKNRLKLELESNQKLRAIYPFLFKLIVEYKLYDNALYVIYNVINTADNKQLFYSIGGHPGFNIPFLKNTAYEDYYLELTKKEGDNRKQYFLSSDSLLLPNTEKISGQKTIFKFSHELFKNEAVIMNLVREREIFTIRHKSLPNFIELTIDNAPFMDFWSSYPNCGDFVSVEPCWGLADPVYDYGEISHKPFINYLNPLDSEVYQYKLTFA